MAYVPVAFILAGMAAYTLLAGADFGAGLWMLLATGPEAPRTRAEVRHAMGPVWEANHVWLIFVLVVCWTGYPVAFGSIASTLAIPLTAAAVGIIFRGAAYALRGQGTSRAAETVMALSSVLTPFSLGTVVGAIATGRVPVGNAAGNVVTSWLNVPSVLIGVVAVAFSGYLAAVYLAADSMRGTSPGLTRAFRTRALVAGVVSGGVALAGVLVMRHSGLDLTRGLALVMVCVSGAAGLATMALCWRSRFQLARLSAALAVAAVVAGWAAAQAPRMLPGMTVTQAAAGRSTLIALVIAVAGGCVVLIPSLALLYSLFLRGRLDAPDAGHVPGGSGGSGGAGGAGVSVPAAIRPPADGEATRPPFVAVGVAVGGLLAGTGLLVFTDPVWLHGLGVACLIASGVSTLTIPNTGDGE
ncbi:MAG TPA: cytochrome d ubiquinol oxidase subunit II [Trebonia sp.]|nr:cytochrome d ubiquinol oxidase subunit II [Trebonia sp.]